MHSRTQTAAAAAAAVKMFNALECASHACDTRNSDIFMCAPATLNVRSDTVRQSDGTDGRNCLALRVYFLCLSLRPPMIYRCASCWQLRVRV